uniref:Iron complex outermembrane recepter protein n=1 Tax=Candidatus Kentrum sp. FW TaxID=2126338 RepID=A0A450TS78_9GAMM|nr:MAG: iron complex outermembrane recepter protein [Candidatus Kentron sp. FW]
MDDGGRFLIHSIKKERKENEMNFQRKTLIDGIVLALASSGLLVGSGVRAEGQTMLEEVSVTAEKRVEKLQDVPISVKAFSANEIVEAGIEDTQDFINLTPNVTLDDSYTIGNTFVTVRGVSQLNNIDSPMAIVVDGVPQNNQKQLKQELFDIERIEVLRGPQGSAYGRNAIGGAINIITKGPTREREGYVKTGIFNGNGKTVSGAISGPLVEDTLLYRLSGNYKDSDGLIDNDYLGTEVDSYEATDLRAQLRWLATADFSVDLVYQASNLDGGAIYDSLLRNNGGNRKNTNTVVDPYMNTLGTSERSTDDFHVKADLEFDAGTLSYMFGYTDLEEDYYGDIDFEETKIDEQFQDLDVELISHELRWTSPDEERFRWIAGAFHQDTDRTLRGGGALPSISVPPYSYTNDNENTAWAVFGQAEYDLTDRLELSGSLRYDRDERKQVSAGLEETFDAWQPKTTLSYKLTGDNLVYATYGIGFRSGGFNSNGSMFKDETLDNYEIGTKNTFFNRRLIVNGAAYFAQSDDFQFFYVASTPTGLRQIISNIDEVDIKGLELEFQGLPTDNLQVFGGIGITDTEIRKSQGRPQDVGNHTPKNTLYTANLGAQYGFGLGPMDASLRVDMERRGKKYWHSDNVEVQDPVTLYNARFTLERGDFQLVFWGKNLSDERYYTDFNDITFSGFPSGDDIGFINQPRSFGMDVRYDF